jgi:hypothetical protein
MLRRLIPIFSIICILSPLPVLAVQVQLQSFVIWRQPLSRGISNVYLYEHEKTSSSSTPKQQGPINRSQAYTTSGYESSSPWSDDRYGVEYKSYWENTKDNGSLSY